MPVKGILLRTSLNPPLVHELQPGRVPEAVGAVEEAVVVDEVAVAGVVGRVDVDALDLARVGHAQEAQGIEVVPLDDQVPVGRVPLRQFPIQIEGDEVVVQAPVGLDLVPLPDKPVGRFPFTAFEQGDQLLLGQVGYLLMRLSFPSLFQLQIKIQGDFPVKSSAQLRS